ncbi:MAG: DUF962 domain-containing protein [Gammaproteobacteria bacterium]
MEMATPVRLYSSFADFYPDYLRAHQNRSCRRLHFLGTTLVLLIVIGSVLSAEWRWLFVLPIAGYGPAWIGHFYFERNRPATFSHPLYSLIGDFRMYVDMLSGKVSL